MKTDQLIWGKPTDGWQISISMDKQQFLLGLPVHATIVTKNVSGKTLSIPAPRSKWVTYKLRLRDEFGDVPLTRFGKRMEENRGDGSYTEPEIQANDKIVAEIPISRLFDLTLRGRYTLEVSRAIFQQGTKNEVSLVSNEIFFEIVEE